MSSQLASVVTILVIFYLFYIDQKNRVDKVSRALWVPYAWMFISGSRFISLWLDPGASFRSPESYMDGSPLDRMVFLLLIMLGIVILLRRKLNWKLLFRNNMWIILLLLYELTSIIWSDYSFISFKRWIKALGTPVMALVILTEKRPLETLGILFRRLSFILLPLSILYIKYYPHLGRAYHMGQPMFTGVATQKNGLGQLCLILSTYYYWDLLFNPHKNKHMSRYKRFFHSLLILSMAGWLLYMANSSTSWGCLIIAIGILTVSKIPSVSRKPGRIIGIGVIAIAVLVILEFSIDLTAKLIVAMGRDITLTTRVPMWNTLLSMARSPWFGFGHESFWLGNRLNVLFEMFGGLNQAHNGYLETYLNIGIFGLALIIAVIVTGLVNVRAQMKYDYRFAIIKLTFIVVVAVYNWTEATLHGVNNILLLLYLSVIEVHVKNTAPSFAELSRSASYHQYTDIESSEIPGRES